jgi:hypothetical protein
LGAEPLGESTDGAGDGLVGVFGAVGAGLGLADAEGAGVLEPETEVLVGVLVLNGAVLVWAKTGASGERTNMTASATTRTRSIYRECT